jgi:small ligand-binding sensory domain FIST
MKWASAISDLPELGGALEAALDDATQTLEARTDLAVVFVSGHAVDLGRVPFMVRERVGNALILGCSAGGVVGGGIELEGKPGVAITLASLPSAELVPFHINPMTLRGELDPKTLQESMHPVSDGSALLTLADPFTLDGPALVSALDGAFPSAVKIGGLASGARAPGNHLLFLGDATHTAGAVGVEVRGVTVDTLVAQGCRPIGDAMFVTRHRGHVILELNGKPAAQVVRALFDTLSPGDQELFGHSLFLGIGMTDKREYQHGDFLIRNIGGVQRETGGLVVGATFGEFDVVQFHLRDARASAEDLDALLTRYHNESPTPPAGALLFSCLGRGTGLYGAPNHDSDAFHRIAPGIPLGGFFCNGEIGPVRGRTHLHGYTSCFAMFR